MRHHSSFLIHHYEQTPSQSLPLPRSYHPLVGRGPRPRARTLRSPDQRQMINIQGRLTFKIDWLEEEWGVETWVVVEKSPDPSNYIISKASPLGRALVNGDEIFTSPEGQKRYRIVEVKDDVGNNINVADLKKKAFSAQRNVPTSNPVAIRVAGLIRESLSDLFRNRISIPLPELDDNDIRLSQRWYGIDHPVSRVQIITEYDEKAKYEIAKMLSARAAEKAVIHFLERMLTGDIKDISLSQLNNSTSQTEWKKYDILADGIAYDVKNSRRTRLNPSNYVEHCVPRYKEVRGKDVKVIGALSHYLWVNELLDHEAISGFRQTSIRVLGCTDGTIIKKLTDYFEKDTFKLEFHRHQQNGYFLPPWIFDYPASYYVKRDEALFRVIETVSLDDWMQSHRNPVPVYLALGLEPPMEWQEKMQYTWQADFIQCILRSHKEFGLSLPVVFLTILTHFLDMAVNQSQVSGGYNPMEYRNLLFATRNDSSPLFLHDPLETVDSLIETLTILWNTQSDRIQDYSSFRLVSSGILRGRLKNDPNKEQSLVAYCGGTTKDKSPCGNVPLVLGKHQHCKKCGKLICDKCGYCSRQCPDNAIRQANFNPPQISNVAQYNDTVDFEDEIPF